MSLVYLSKSAGRRNTASALAGSAAFAFSGGSTIGAAIVQPPTGLFVDTTTSTSVSLDWNNSPQGDHLSFDLQHDDNAGFTSPTTVNSIGSSTYNVTGLTEGTTYYFRVRDVTSNGTSDWSSSVSATPSGATTYNVFPFAVPSIFDNDTGIVNAGAQWQVTSETPLDGAFTYQNGGGFTYTSVSSGSAQFDYQIIDFDGAGNNTQATVTVNVVP